MRRKLKFSCLPGVFSLGLCRAESEYCKEGHPGCYSRKIRFTDTQDKSEEEIMTAIKFYYSNSQRTVL
jgi:hypothetical protein